MTGFIATLVIILIVIPAVLFIIAGAGMLVAAIMVPLAAIVRFIRG